ncbi:hypothetical protein ABW21_db0203452 [Orbilia brochopaga]|nr:hypothetical protein ABW21_db0203452 [Drechslerella brochopaga]
MECRDAERDVAIPVMPPSFILQRRHSSRCNIPTSSSDHPALKPGSNPPPLTPPSSNHRLPLLYIRRITRLLSTQSLPTANPNLREYLTSEHQRIWLEKEYLSSSVPLRPSAADTTTGHPKAATRKPSNARSSRTPTRLETTRNKLTTPPKPPLAPPAITASTSSRMPKPS